MEKEILNELKEIKELLQVIASNQEQSVEVKMDAEKLCLGISRKQKYTPKFDQLGNLL